MSADPGAALATATRHRTETTRARARDAVRRLDRDGHPITFTAVADAADVSRSLLYRDPALRAQIEALRTRQLTAGPGQPPAMQRSTIESLQQRLAAALDDNRALRTENQQLRDRIATALGEQRATTIPARPASRAIGPCS
jgi:hypothetical protein